MATATKKKKAQKDGYSPRLKDRFDAEIRERLKEQFWLQLRHAGPARREDHASTWAWATRRSTRARSTARSTS